MINLPIPNSNQTAISHNNEVNDLESELKHCNSTCAQKVKNVEAHVHLSVIFLSETETEFLDTFVAHGIDIGVIINL
jgi:hypothetical protein